MKIGVDITMLVYTGSGVANYTFNLIRELLLTDKTNEYRLFYSSLRRPKNFYYLDELKKLGAKVYDWRFPPSLLKLWWGKWHIMPVEWFIGKVDVFYSSDFLRPPLLKGTKGVTTVHDLIWKIYPEFHEDFIVEAHAKKLAKTVKYGDTVLVDSQSTKKDLKKYYPQMQEEKIHVIYPAVAEYFRPIKDKPKISQVLSKYLNNQETNSKYSKQLPITNNQIPNYLLYVGAIEPRKNIDKAIAAFADLLKNEKFSDFKFLIVGRAGWKNEKIFALVEKLNLKDRVIFVGFVEDKDLPYFYSGAKLSVYLSQYEGFGLPPLESLSCGTPTIAGENSSMKETIDKKFLVNVDEQTAIVAKMKELLTDKVTIDPQEIKRKFSWNEAAKKFLQIISSQ